MRNIKFLPAYMLGAVLLGSCNTDCVDGSGNQVSETRDVGGDFSGIEVNGDVRLLLTQADASSVRVVADDNIQAEVDIRRSGSELVIEHESGTCESGDIIVYVSMKDLRKIDASGAVEIVGQSPFKVGDIELSLKGANTLSMELDAATVETNSSGASEISLKGQAGRHVLDMSGATELDAFNFIVGEYEVESSGAGSAQINVLNRLDVESAGATEILYKGNPSKIKTNNSGASNVKRVN